MFSNDGYNHPCHPMCPCANVTLPLLPPIFPPLARGQVLWLIENVAEAIVILYNWEEPWKALLVPFLLSWSLEPPWKEVRASLLERSHGQRGPDGCWAQEQKGPSIWVILAEGSDVCVSDTTLDFPDQTTGNTALLFKLIPAQPTHRIMS